jgi:hypothetical protein
MDYENFEEVQHFRLPAPRPTDVFVIHGTPCMMRLAT